MTHDINDYGQPVGPELAHWKAPSALEAECLEGRFCRLEPLDAGRHAESLWQAWREPAPALDNDHEACARWTYLGGRPFDDEAGCRAWLARMGEDRELLCYAVVDLADGQAVGLAAYLNSVPVDGRIEIGHLNFSPRLSRTPMSSEALMLMMAHAFDKGYRRLEWKCDALNAPSRRAAERLGFRFEGVFRQHRVVAGRNRDTAWFAVLDGEWPAIRDCHRRWLAPENFDAAGRQRRSLASMTAALQPANSRP
ncbi:GNAT family N-acetyltransferase [Halomonas elongata]|uniref:GNAT family acetyltransferase n=1 Tax=Halomonas elongata (strain ATCC 33173 / DSM 2581 / NBRC 15536 / NCIMB 2198 / 1H9) TaxID=768066 RepID=E1V5A6_HALED|nr:GNAT family protein [Halomonas elongata]WBF16801.1 GNAT family N-acetyltransferase [Halomonas elongata]WPU45632.1 GNAT family protein [Halomonas elongata DSM 2581]CBV43061.1 GNAT family acetyltransferase [Halomonas elongata DSM 2581]